MKQVGKVPQLAVLGQTRGFQYPIKGVSARASPCQRETMRKHSEVLSPAMAATLTSESARMTGASWSPNVTSANMYDEAQFGKDFYKSGPKHYVNSERWKVDPVDPAMTVRVVTLLEGMTSAQTDAIWENLFKSAPNLRKPMTAEVQTQFVDFYMGMCKLADNEKAMSNLASSFVIENLEQRFITQAYWWRIHDAFVAAVMKIPSMRPYEATAVKLVLEAVTKTSLNTLADQPWATQDFTSSQFADYNSARIVHDAGFW